MVDLNSIREGYKTINGTSLYFKTIGTGIPIVVIHGGPGLAHNYLFDYFSQLSDNYQIIFYDQRSCGLSSGNDSVKDITMTNFVEDIEELRKEFNIVSLNLIGQSFGGLIALSYAVKYPKNLSSLLILESAAANLEADSKFELNLNRRMSDLDKDQLAKYDSDLETSNFKSEIMKKYFNILFKSYFFDQKYLLDLSFDYLTDQMVEKLFLSAPCITQDPKLLELLSVIECPTLIIHGDYDPIPFDDIRLIHDAIPQSEFIVLKDCGHFAHIEKQTEYFEKIRMFYNKHIGKI